MERTHFIRKLVAGMFFVTGIMIVAVVVLVIGIQKGLTLPKFQMTILYREVGGLTVGAPVYLSGVSVGTVGAIDFVDGGTEGRGVKVVLNVYEKYRPQLAQSARFVIKTEGVLGEKTIEISRSTTGQRIDVNRPVIGEDPLDVQDLAKLFGDTSAALKETSETINSIITEMKHISTSTKRLLNRIELRVIEGNLFKVF